MAANKATGPDGIPAEFYTQFEYLILERLHAVLTEAVERGWLDENMREGDINLLYKKGDAREVRNYRPITLLQTDYKIYYKLMVARMKTVCESFVSRPQVGFVPKRVIGEATHLLKLIQAYYYETEEEGLILALDWEKAFDRCSCDYLHLAFEALHFGPHFIPNLTTMSNKYSPPVRKVKQNGIRGKPFSILSGVPQGCPFSPLAFLVIAEGLTRLIIESDIAGITVGNTTHKLSQFADDTQLLLKGYLEILKVWPLLDQYERASGMRANAQKMSESSADYSRTPRSHQTSHRRGSLSTGSNPTNTPKY